MERYPLSRPDHLFVTLAEGKIFSKLDLSLAYLQLQLDDACYGTGTFIVYITYTRCMYVCGKGVA